jgi:hypothetical protein
VGAVGAITLDFLRCADALERFIDEQAAFPAQTSIPRRVFALQLQRRSFS